MSRTSRDGPSLGRVAARGALVAVALANKMGRIAWALLANGCLASRQHEKGLANGRMRFTSVRS